MTPETLRIQDPIDAAAAEPRRCEQPGCSRVTWRGKRFCALHVVCQPYAAGLRARLERQRVELQRVRRLGPRAVDPSGLTAREIQRCLEVQGPRSLEDLARHVELTRSTTRTYVRALVGRGRLRVVRGVEGPDLVTLARG